MATASQACQTSPKALSIEPAKHEYLRRSKATNNVAKSGNKGISPEANSIESPLLESPPIATPTLRPPVPALQAPHVDAARTNEHLSSSAAQAKAFLHGPETPKTLVQENHSLLHLLDSKMTWSENSDVTIAPYQEIEPELRPTQGGWFRGLGRWFGYSKQAAGVIPEVKIELDDMPVDEFPIIPHTSGQYKPPWLSLAPNRQLGQSIVATLDFSVFDRVVVGDLLPPPLSNASDEEDSN